MRRMSSRGYSAPTRTIRAGFGGRAPVPRPSGAGPRWLFVLVGFCCKGDRPEGLVCEIESGGNEEPAARRGGEDNEEIGDRSPSRASEQREPWAGWGRRSCGNPDVEAEGGREDQSMDNLVVTSRPSLGPGLGPLTGAWFRNRDRNGTGNRNRKHADSSQDHLLPNPGPSCHLIHLTGAAT
ncbi:hypothetical protein BKA56DRAFT_50278 [Ilyonectria sp. MPI-CAGE-AT-0026]|nr:hypothetical protein BKA56DRAFT_50278 [Ilyonectria sp. MPI-CAGE-AT-0026]